MAAWCPSLPQDAKAGVQDILLIIRLGRPVELWPRDQYWPSLVLIFQTSSKYERAWHKMYFCPLHQSCNSYLILSTNKSYLHCRDWPYLATISSITASYYPVCLFSQANTNDRQVLKLMQGS